MKAYNKQREPKANTYGALLMVSLGALSASIVVGHATAYARVVAAAISVAMYYPKVHGYWATTGCFPVYPQPRILLVNLPSQTFVGQPLTLRPELMLENLL